MEDLPNAGRGWEAVVIGEPSRAFYGSQFALTFPLFTHYRVGLWVPEVGGAIDPGSEAHDLVMNLFGGLSKGERTRIQVRVRSAMEALAAEGNRFLGGRPPYGYTLADAGPHPNPTKAVAGQRLHRLEPDPITAPSVRRIFSMYASDEGLRFIAERLSKDGIPSPAAYDRARNRHRDPRGWSHTAIRAILTNPIYGGRSVRGKQRRFEELLDLNDVSAGHVTRMRWRAPSEWIEATTPRTQALVDEATLAAVANRIGGGARREKQRDAVHPYLLRGIVRCDLCGRKMQGSARRSRTAGSPTRVLYRCEFGARRSVPVGMDHPPTVYVREDAIVSRLDAWLAEIVTPEALAGAQAMPPDVAAQHVAVRAAMADCDVRIKRLLESIESGIDHELVAPRVRELQAERSRLEATLGAHKVWRRLSAREIAEWADSLGGVVQVLKQANPEDRAALYAEFGLTLRYDPTRHQIKATAELSRVGRGVGGGTFPHTTRETIWDLAA